MKKIFSLTGIMVMAVVVSSSAFAGSTGIGSSTVTLPTMGVSSLGGQTKLGVQADSNYPNYGYTRSDGNRGRHRGDSWNSGGCGRW